MPVIYLDRVQDIAAVLVLAVFEQAEDAATASALARACWRGGYDDRLGRWIGLNLVPHGRTSPLPVRPAVLLSRRARPVLGWVVVDEDLVGGVSHG